MTPMSILAPTGPSMPSLSRHQQVREQFLAFCNYADNLDPSKVRNATQYISVDGRPVSSERGTMREIAKSYKRHVQKSVLNSTGPVISRPFLCMQIRCPA